jgi:hypothetical protein
MRFRVLALPNSVLSGRFHRNDLAAFVKAARRANPVRHSGRGALRALVELRQFQDAVVGAAHPLAAV